MRILVTDDSAVARRLLKQALLSMDGVSEVDVASHGRIALGKLAQSKFDLLVLDLEMPELDGLDTLRELKKIGVTVPVLVFASETHQAAQKTLEALRLGAWDFIAKPVADSFDPDLVVGLIADAVRPKIRLLRSTGVLANQFGSMPAVGGSLPIAKSFSQPAGREWKKIDIELFRPQAIVIGSSTGGPMALDKVFSTLKETPRVPIFIVQHMPPLFTKSLAESLGKLTGLRALEAEDGCEVEAGTIRVAPGGFHMSLRRTGTKTCLHLDQDEPIHYVRPAADRLFLSAAEVYGQGCLAIVLTGMGEDGCEGAKAIKRAGGAVMIQDEASSIVWGMPGSVHRQGAFDFVGNPNQIAQYLVALAR